MLDQKVLEVQRGIWIDEQAIRSARLGARLRVVVQPGEIRILAMPTKVEREEAPKSEKGWDVFRSLGRDAQPGQLSNAAAEHDRYLYGKGQ
jgi:ribosomal protein L16/L10AE